VSFAVSMTLDLACGLETLVRRVFCAHFEACYI
jgi:hypothetical protein